MSGGSKVALGCGCLLAVIAFVAIIVVAFIQFVSIATV